MGAAQFNQLMTALNALKTSLTGQPATNQQQPTATQATIRPKLMKLTDSDDIDSFLSMFESTATASGWPREQWATQLYPVLSGPALETMSGLSVDTFADYDAVKTAILEKYSVTNETYRIRFRSGRKEEKESYGEFGMMLATNFNRWLSLTSLRAQAENLVATSTRPTRVVVPLKDLEEIFELLQVEQFTEAVPYHLQVALRERQFKTLKEAVSFTEASALARKTTKDCLKTGGDNRDQRPGKEGRK